MGSSEPRVGDRLGRYTLLEVLGCGGMGTVFRARDDDLERDVAVKVINALLADDSEFRERFRREAVVLSRMDSAHVVSVFDHGEQDGSPYLVAQLVRGGDLMDLLRARGALDPTYAVDLVDQVLEGLGDAHAIGVVHRDVKPSNVLLREDGRVAYLCDFGIATSPGRELTRTGALVGSTAYMAPERHSGDTAGTSGVAADLYAVGCLLWNLLTGTQPFVGTDAEVAMGHLRAPVPQLPGRDPFLDRINAVFRRSLAKDPKQRYGSARAMRADLAALKDVIPGAFAIPDVTAVRQPLTTPPTRTGTRRVLVTAVVVALVASAVYVGSLLGGVEMVPSVLASDDATTSATPETATSEATQGQSDGSRDTSVGGTRATDPTSVPGGETDSLPEEQAEPEPATTQGTPKPRRTPTPTPTPESVATHRCWNGPEVQALSSCTQPTGRSGSSWVFPGAAKVPNCSRLSRSTPGFIEGWGCTIRTADGTNKSITFIRWSSVTAATDYFWARYNADQRTRDAWLVGGHTYGRAMYGRVGKQYHSARVYAAAGTIPWSVSAQANTSDKRTSMLMLVSYRAPGQFRGVPIN